eukprot:TRINITY_DN2419_c0_g1_i1.p1 TRINITY_DN2419_c0_g1~~TRINITY_DN2419_c0_g1_i1.p1  ORF type:complete len:311 (+),score=43.54 TRINITY_DN2419_c0_g1_i1:372-1304(+)
MEYIFGDDLFDFVMNNGNGNGLPEAQAAIIFEKLCLAIHKLHTRNIVHHDLKLENIMIATSERDLHVKLIDFGLSIKGEATTGLLEEFSGTEAYSAPELLIRKPYCGKALDVYSLGVIFFIMLTGGYPFSTDVNLHHQEQTDAEFLANLSYPAGVSNQSKDLILHMLEKDPAKRPSMATVLTHPFFGAMKKYQVSLKHIPTPFEMDTSTSFSFNDDFKTSPSDEELAAAILQDMECSMSYSPKPIKSKQTEKTPETECSTASIQQAWDFHPFATGFCNSVDNSLIFCPATPLSRSFQGDHLSFQDVAMVM